MIYSNIEDDEWLLNFLSDFIKYPEKDSKSDHYLVGPPKNDKNINNINQTQRINKKELLLKNVGLEKKTLLNLSSSGLKENKSGLGISKLSQKTNKGNNDIW